MKDVLVVGAGLSGLATAWYLREAGASVEIVDAAGRPGGLIHTLSTPHGPVETAANAFIRSPRVDTLFAALELAPSVPLPASRNRFIFRDGRPHKWPLTIGETASTVARAGAAWLTRRMTARDGETVDSWGRRVLGSAATDWLVGPALHGIYASPPEALSARAVAASRPKGRREFIAPPDGMGQFMERMHTVLVRRDVTFTFGMAIMPEHLSSARRTVVATSASAASRLLLPHAPAFARASSRVVVAPASPVTAFFEPHERDLRGFGVLFPRGAGMTALGVRFNADIFEGRGPLRSETWIYSGASRDAAALTVTLRDDRRLLTGDDRAPLSVHPTIWPEAIPVYGEAVLETAAARQTLPPWLSVAGNYLGRIGVTGLLDIAAEAAERVVR